MRTFKKHTIKKVKCICHKSNIEIVNSNFILVSSKTYGTIELLPSKKK